MKQVTRLILFLLIWQFVCLANIFSQTNSIVPQVLAPPAGKIKVTFKVVVPENTPLVDIIYLMGSMNNWDPGPASPPDSSDIPLTFEANNGWQVILYLTPEVTYYYKFTRGSLETIEKAADSSDINNRSIYVSDEVEPVLEDVVENWADLSIRTVPENVTPVLSMFNSSPYNSVAITWVSDTTGESKIQYGKLDINENAVLVDNHYDLMKKDDNLIHYYKLTGLDPDTEYRYKVSTEGVFESEEFNFKTACCRGEKY